MRTCRHITVHLWRSGQLAGIDFFSTTVSSKVQTQVIGTYAKCFLPVELSCQFPFKAFILFKYSMKTDIRQNRKPREETY